MPTVTPVVVSNARHVAKSGEDVVASPAIGQSTGQTTSSTSEVSLTTVVLPAGLLAINNQMVRIRFGGSVAGVGTGTPRMKFGATYVDNNIAYTNQDWLLECVVVRTGAATQRSHMFQLAGGSAVVGITTAPAETLSGAITVDFRGVVSVGTATLSVETVLVEYLAV